MIIYQEPTVTIEYDEEKCQIIQKWKGFSSSDTFRNAVMKTSQFAQANPVYSVISDTLEQSIVKAEDVQFAASRMPQAAFGDIKAMAFIMPKKLFAQLAVKKFGDEAKMDFIQYFDSYETAQEWINSRLD